MYICDIYLSIQLLLGGRQAAGSKSPYDVLDTLYALPSRHQNLERLRDADTIVILVMEQKKN